MNASEPLPLNESHERHIADAFAALEKLLAELLERLERNLADLRLTY